VVPAYIVASHFFDSACTGSVEMSVFQVLSIGNTAQLVPGM